MRTMPQATHQERLPLAVAPHRHHDPAHQSNNKLHQFDRGFHEWYRFVLSYPPHLVRQYLQAFEADRHCIVLDPFCGTGTTLVEAKLTGIRSAGIEANPIAHFASTVKLSWNIDAQELEATAAQCARRALLTLLQDGIDDDIPVNGNLARLKLRTLDADTLKLLLTNSISPVPLHKALVLLDEIRRHESKPCYNHLLLAFAKALVFSISNLRFGPEVGVGKAKHDVAVVEAWLREVSAMVSDLRSLDGKRFPASHVYLGDSRQAAKFLKPQSVDCVITSPPYPNEKDYTRTTRLEAVLLGFINSRDELRQFKHTLLRSNTRNVYKGDDDHQWIAGHKRILDLAERIEKRRIELGKTSGFEKLYASVTRLYFGGMARHLYELQRVLKPGAMLGYVVGDQASYLQVMIRTGELLGEVAEALGYKLERIDLFRTRFATATGEQLREEVVVLRWPGKKG
jgi:SAM-dependent methyltransferase